MSKLEISSQCQATLTVAVTLGPWWDPVPQLVASTGPAFRPSLQHREWWRKMFPCVSSAAAARTINSLGLSKICSHLDNLDSLPCPAPAVHCWSALPPLHCKYCWSSKTKNSAQLTLIVKCKAWLRLCFMIIVPDYLFHLASYLPWPSSWLSSSHFTPTLDIRQYTEHSPQWSTMCDT